MTSNELIERIRRELGNSQIMIELAIEDISIAIKSALELYSSYTNEVSYVPVAQAANPISLETLNICTVIRVFESPNGAFRFPNAGEFSLNLNPGLATEVAMWNARLSNISTIIDKNFRVDGSNLYVDAMQGNLTLEVIKYVRIEDVRDPYWQNWIVSYSVAKCKEIIGNMRGKYTLNNAPYQIDSETIKSQGIDAMNNLKQELTTAGGFFTIVR